LQQAANFSSCIFLRRNAGFHDEHTSIGCYVQVRLNILLRLDGCQEKETNSALLLCYASSFPQQYLFVSKKSQTSFVRAS